MTTPPKPNPAAESPPTRDRTTTWSLLVGSAVLALCAVSIRDFGITIDEPRYIENNERILRWLGDFAEVGWQENLSADRLRDGWYFARGDSKNLPMVSIVSTLGDVTIGRFDSKPAAHRWGGIVVFAVTCAVLFHWVARELSIPAAVVGVAALVGTPRLFANANLLSIDPLVASFWVLASWALAHSHNHWRWSLAFAVLAGLGMTTKPTFWFAIPAWLAWGLLFRPRELWRAALLLVTVGPLTTWAFVPMWWAAPLDGPLAYLDLLRNDPVGWKIDAYYLGEIYQAEGFPPLPWHAVPVLACVTTPLWVLLLAGWGAWSGRRNSHTRELAWLWGLSAVAVPVVCMLPGTPAHDGVRLYRVCFYFLAPLAALGTHQFLGRRSQRIQVTLAGLAVAAAAWGIWSRHPAEMSAYNVLTGGLSGAAELRDYPATLPEPRRPRFEVTYWFDLLTPNAVGEMQEHLPPNARLWVFPEDAGVALMQQWGHLRADIQLSGPDTADFVLIYGRMGRLLDPRAVPLGNQFLYAEAAWEQRIDGVRTIALFRR